MTNEILILATAALALAGFVQGLTGFGFGITAMSLLPWVLGLDEAHAVVTLTSTAACLLMCAVTLRDAPWPRLWMLAVCTAAGVPLGFWLFEALPRTIVMRVLGLTLCSMVLFDLLVARHLEWRWPRWLEPLVGIGSGILTGAFNVGGPPLVAYIYSQPWSKHEHVAGLTAVFISGGLVRVALLFAHRDVPPDVWKATAWSVLPMLAAIILGNRLLTLIPQQRLRAGVFTVLLFLGGRYLLAG